MEQTLAQTEQLSLKFSQCQLLPLGPVKLYTVQIVSKYLHSNKQVSSEKAILMNFLLSKNLEKDQYHCFTKSQAAHF